MIVDLSNITDEANLVKRCQNNDPNAQKILYNMYVADMMILCLRYIPNKEDAKERLMDGFLNCFSNMKQFNYQGTGSIKAWLKKIMINQCLMHLRKRKPFAAGRQETDLYEDRQTTEDVLSHLSAKEILQVLHTLPDGYRTVFNLYVFDEMTHREIGVLLDITENTSKSQLHRAKALLREKIILMG